MYEVMSNKRPNRWYFCQLGTRMLEFPESTDDRALRICRRWARMFWAKHIAGLRQGNMAYAIDSKLSPRDWTVAWATISSAGTIKTDRHFVMVVGAPTDVSHPEV